MTALPIRGSSRTSAAVDRVLARLVDPQAIGDKRWKGTCPLHGAGCALDIRLARDGSARLSCARQAAIGELLDALQLTLEDVGPPMRLSPERLARLDAQTAKLERELVAAALDKPETVLPALAARGFDPAVLPSPVLRAILAVMQEAWARGGGLDVLLLADEVARRGVCDASTAKTEVGLLLATGVEVEAIDERCHRLEDAAARRTLAERLAATRALTLDSELAPLDLVTEARAILEETAQRLQVTVAAEAPTMAELLADPKALADDVVVVPRLAWQGRATLLSGREKEGKSSYLGAAVAAVSRGRDFCGVPVPAGDVLWIGIDEPRRDVLRRLAHHEADGHRVRIVEQLPQGVEGLRRLLAQHRPALTIVDSLTGYAHGLVESMNDRAQMSRVLFPLIHAARAVDTALVLVHHDKKAGDGYSDSQTIGATVDVILQWKDPKVAGDLTRREVEARGRIAVPHYAVRLDAVGAYVAVDTADVPIDVRILSLLEAQPLLSFRQLADAIGGRAANVQEAVRRLVAFGKVIDANGGGTKKAAYRLTTHEEAAQGPDAVRTYRRRSAQ